MFTAPLKGGIYASKMFGIDLTFARSSLCFILISVTILEVPSPREVDGEYWTPHVDDACTPADILLSDMTFSVLRSMSTSFADSSSVVRSSDICTQDY
jgi:hypothetical protein